MDVRFHWMIIYDLQCSMRFEKVSPVLSFFRGDYVVMQRQQIDVLPGQSVLVGNLIVTVLSVNGDEVELRIEDPDNTAWTDPVDRLDHSRSEPVLA